MKDTRPTIYELSVVAQLHEKSEVSSCIRLQISNGKEGCSAIPGPTSCRRMRNDSAHMLAVYVSSFHTMGRW